MNIDGDYARCGSEESTALWLVAASAEAGWFPRLGVMNAEQSDGISGK
jgi:hypothetical protein